MKDAKWLNGLKKAAEYCGVSVRTIRGWVKNGDLKVNKVSKKMILVERSEIDECIHRKGAAPNSNFDSYWHTQGKDDDDG